MLAQRTDEVSWQFISLVDVAADLTDPTLGLLLGSGLDVGLVIVVGNRRYVVQDRRLGDVTKEHPVRTHVHGGIDLQGQEGVGALGQVRKTVGSTLTVLESLELVRISAGLESKPLEQAEGSILAERADVQNTCAADNLTGVVGLVHVDHDTVRLVADLRHGVDDETCVLLTVIAGDYVETVADLEHGRYLDGFSALWKNTLHLGQFLCQCADLSASIVVQCGEDSDVILRKAEQGEGYTGIGKDFIDMENMLVLADDEGIFGSSMSDSTRAMVTENANDILVVVYCFENDIDLETLLDEAKRDFERYALARDIEAWIV